nr:hypothetical protein [Solimonas terrae]
MAPDASLLAVGGHGVVRLRDLAAQRWRWSVRLPIDHDADADVTVLAFSADGRRLLATAKRAQAFVLDATSGQLLSQVRDASSAYFTSGRFDAAGTQIVLGDWGNLAYLWRPRDQRWLSLSGHTSAVEAVSFTADGALAMSAGNDGAIRVWDSATGELLDAFVAHDDLIQWNGARFTPDGKAIISSGRDGRARLWTLAREDRSATNLARDLRCRASWRVVGDALAQGAADVSACSAAAGP